MFPRVEGTGRTFTPAGDDAIQGWVRDGCAAKAIPSTIEAYSVTVEVVPGGFHAL